MRLSEKAMLVKVSMGWPGNSRPDKRLTEEVKAEKSMGQNSGRWIKTLYPPDDYNKLMAMDAKVRDWVNDVKHSLLWKEDGWRILLSANYLDFQEKMRQFQRECEAARDEFLSHYDHYVEWARVEQNGNFDPDNYPGADAILDKFKFDVSFRPLPTGDDFRVMLQEDEVRAIKSQINKDSLDSIKGAMVDLGKKFMEPIRHMAEKLKDKDAQFKKTMIENIAEMIDLIPSMNLTSDKMLDQFAQDAKALLVNDAQTLREDQQARADTARKAEEILAKMSGYFGQ